MKKILLILVLVVFPIKSFALFPKFDSDKLGIDSTKIMRYKGDFNIPFKANPNLDTLKYYMFKYNSDPESKPNQRIIKPSQKPYEFNSELKKFKFLNKEFSTKGIVSYLYYEKDKIIINEISPKDRLGELVNNKTKLRSNSMGKSLVSYILGHAICEGHIKSVDSSISDWPLMKNSLYENHKLIDLLNMASGDQAYVNDSFLLKNGKRSRDGIGVDNMSAKFLGMLFQKKKVGKKIYNYNQNNPNLILNYVLFKSKGSFQEILDKTFKEKAKIKNSVLFYKKGDPEEHGNADSMFYASRYDWLRIAKAVMDDYQNDTCVGKYLKEIYNRKIPKGAKEFEEEPGFNKTYSYGGQFHLDYPGIKNKVVFGMGGRGGQAVLIDMEDSRIIVINSIHYNKDRYKYNVKKLLINPIKKGEEAFK